MDDSNVSYGTCNKLLVKQAEDISVEDWKSLLINLF